MKTLNLKILVEELDSLERGLIFGNLDFNQVMDAQKRLDEIYLEFGLTASQADLYIRTIH